jgi:hypothetical protein
MSKVVVDISVSLDGFIAGPDPSREEPLGRGGEALHEWGLTTKGWREPHGYEGGETGPDSAMMERGFANLGAVVMGRRMFGGDGRPVGRSAVGGLVGGRSAVPCPRVRAHEPRA